MGTPKSIQAHTSTYTAKSQTGWINQQRTTPCCTIVTLSGVRLFECLHACIQSDREALKLKCMCLCVSKQDASLFSADIWESSSRKETRRWSKIWKKTHKMWAELRWNRQIQFIESKTCGSNKDSGCVQTCWERASQKLISGVSLTISPVFHL